MTTLTIKELKTILDQYDESIQVVIYRDGNGNCYLASRVAGSIGTRAELSNLLAINAFRSIAELPACNNLMLLSALVIPKLHQKQHGSSMENAESAQQSAAESAVLGLY